MGKWGAQTYNWPWEVIAKTFSEFTLNNNALHEVDITNSQQNKQLVLFSFAFLHSAGTVFMQVETSAASLQGHSLF